MSDSIKVSSQSLRDTATNIRNYNTTLDEDLTSVNREMQALSSSWRSDAADAIRENINAMLPKFQQYKEIVEQYAAFLDSTANAYEETESAIQNNANAFK